MHSGERLQWNVLIGNAGWGHDRLSQAKTGRLKRWQQATVMVIYGPPTIVVC